jgi:hypothetical protein
LAISCKIPEYLEDCPQGWKNFIADMLQRRGPDDNGGFQESTIQSELDKFRASYDDQELQYSDLVFNDEWMYSVFVLKYGAI